MPTRRLAVLAAPAFLSAASTGARAAAGPVGQYVVEGRRPDGVAYIGTVDVLQTEDTFRVIWLIEGIFAVGTGIGGEASLSISYQSGRRTGVALLANEGGTWAGVWADAGGTRLGEERWSPRYP